MTLFSRKTDYALLILSYLHTHMDGSSAQTISTHFDLSKGFVANILKELCQKNYVISQRGVKGGYLLRRPLDQIPLAELVESLEDGFRLATCTGHSHSANEEGCNLIAVCPVRSPITELHHRILEMMRTVTVADLLKPSLPNRETTFQAVLNLPSRERISKPEIAAVGSS